MAIAAHTDIRELDHRANDRIDVKLLWSARTNRVWIDVHDGRGGPSFELDIDPGDALEAFRHPYAYAS